MIEWVYIAVSQISEINQVFVATDDERILHTVEDFGGNAIMTGACSCGTERVYEACKELNFDVVLNVQGDEPMIHKGLVADLISAFEDKEVYMATLKKRIDSEAEIINPNIAKVVTDCDSNAIYFSRSAIPYNREKNKGVTYYKHIGVYGYTKDFIEKYVSLPRTPLERAEELEQLRAVEHGYKIRVIETRHQSIGVDLPEHIPLVEGYMAKEVNKI
jgi:3-deoxy-manno-octulosonate cytidylyltransferase (CMP-KDO synthetase)